MLPMRAVCPRIRLYDFGTGKWVTAFIQPIQAGPTYGRLRNIIPNMLWPITFISNRYHFEVRMTYS